MKELENLMSDSYIFITDKGIAVKGSSPEILTYYTKLTSEMLELKGVDKELLENAFNMAFMNTEELYDLFKKELNHFADTLKQITEDKKDTTE